MPRKKKTETEDTNKKDELTSDKESKELEEVLKKSNANAKNLEELYKQNLLLKQQIDRDKLILKKARENFELEIKQRYKELNDYKNDMNSILEKNKNDISLEYDELTKKQEAFEKEKQKFENSKKKQQASFKLKTEQQEALLDTKRCELESIEFDLKLKKEKLDSLRKKLEFDIKEFNTKKQELANNLGRFNSLVASLGRGMDKIKDKNTEK